MIQIHKILNWLIVKIKQIFMKLYSLKQQNNYPHNDHNDNEFNKNEIVKKKKQNKRKKKQNQIGDIDLINNTTEIIIENEQGEIKKDNINHKIYNPKAVKMDMLEAIGSGKEDIYIEGRKTNNQTLHINPNRIKMRFTGNYREVAIQGINMSRTNEGNIVTIFSNIGEITLGISHVIITRSDIQWSKINPLIWSSQQINHQITQSVTSNIDNSFITITSGGVYLSTFMVVEKEIITSDSTYKPIRLGIVCVLPLDGRIIYSGSIIVYNGQIYIVSSGTINKTQNYIIVFAASINKHNITIKVEMDSLEKQQNTLLSTNKPKKTKS